MTALLYLAAIGLLGYFGYDSLADATKGPDEAPKNEKSRTARRIPVVITPSSRGWIKRAIPNRLPN